MTPRPQLRVGAFADLFAEQNPDAERRAAAVRKWFDHLDESLLGRPKKPVWWEDAPGAEVEVCELGRSLDAVRLLAVYAQRPELELPDELPATLADDPAFDQAEREGFQKSHFGHLLVAECWLPGDFDYSFKCPGPDGDDWTFGSLQALCDQCVFLRRRSFGVDRDACETVANEPLTEGAGFLRQALEGLSRFVVASDRARIRAVPLVLWPRP